MEKLRTVAVLNNYKKDNVEFVGYFHGFSPQSDENGSISIAIIEDEKGKVWCPYSGLIQFINPEPMKDCTIEEDNNGPAIVDTFVCYDKTFINLQESDHVGFGSDRKEAYEDYCKTFFKFI